MFPTYFGTYWIIVIVTLSHVSPHNKYEHPELVCQQAPFICMATCYIFYGESVYTFTRYTPRNSDIDCQHLLSAPTLPWNNSRITYSISQPIHPTIQYTHITYKFQHMYQSRSFAPRACNLSKLHQVPATFNTASAPQWPTEPYRLMLQANRRPASIICQLSLALPYNVNGSVPGYRNTPCL